jgi:predicted enzyme related to lactoylglutathione lyase
VGERTTYEPGTFCWVDVATPDAVGAKAFYGALFGWSMHDVPGGRGTTYTRARLGGADVAGIYGGAPPRWTSYVCVEDADATVTRARELGGAVEVEPFDVGGGRRTEITDPAGAAVAIWEPGEHIGAGRVNEPSALCWNELALPDVAAVSCAPERIGRSPRSAGPGEHAGARLLTRARGGGARRSQPRPRAATTTQIRLRPRLGDRCRGLRPARPRRAARGCGTMRRSRRALRRVSAATNFTDDIPVRALVDRVTDVDTDTRPRVDHRGSDLASRRARITPLASRRAVYARLGRWLRSGPWKTWRRDRGRAPRRCGSRLCIRVERPRRTDRPIRNRLDEPTVVRSDSGE